MEYWRPLNINRHMNQHFFFWYQCHSYQNIYLNGWYACRATKKTPCKPENKNIIQLSLNSSNFHEQLMHASIYIYKQINFIDFKATGK